jgi:hypothetical protein
VSEIVKMKDEGCRSEGASVRERVSEVVSEVVREAVREEGNQ